MQKKKANFSKKQGILTITLICFIVGLVLGGISAKSNVQVQNGQVSTNMETYLKNYESGNEDKIKVFMESFIKYSKVITIIWVLGFVPIGGFLVFMLIMLKGVNYGFTTILLISMFGSSGLITAFIMYLPQSFIIVPAYFFMTYCSINYILYNINYKKDYTYTKKSKILQKYMVTLLIGISLAVAASCVDVFITPKIVEKFL